MSDVIPHRQRGLLFTAFEPSGDQLAAPVIAQLRSLRPDLPIHAIGGPRMEAAGATLIESTGEHAVMLLGALSHAMEHRRRVKRLGGWLAANPIAGHVPVDSPAANWAICNLVRSMQGDAKIMHLVTPQIWAWGGWRIRKLRRLTDHVLCILPFEPGWLKERGVTGTFVGHPLYTDLASTIHDAPAIALPQGSPRLALLPGSRPSEHRRNWRTMLAAYEMLAARHAGLTGVVAAVDEAAAQRLKTLEPRPWPASLELRIGSVNDVLRWCDAALVVSGTATLHTAVFEKPMVVLYNVSRLTWNLLGRFLIRTRTFSLPNLIAQAQGMGRIVPEFVPHFGAVAPVMTALDELLGDAGRRQEQARNLRDIGQAFRGLRFAGTTAQVILRTIAPENKKGT